MQSYNTAFARVYNLRWGQFANQVAPVVQEFYARQPVAQTNPAVLDVCCGTGQLATYFLNRGYAVTGLDLSEPMLAWARENNAGYIARGQAQFVWGDAVHFELEAGGFGLAVSTFDALNHLENLDALQSCFRCVYSVLAPDGVFIFDLNTRLGLQRWNSINVEDTDEVLIVNRGIYDGGDRAYTRISGFIRKPDGLYERFEMMAFNTAFDLAAVEGALREVGFASVQFVRLANLTVPLDEPEREARVFIVARRGTARRPAAALET